MKEIRCQHNSSFINYYFKKVLCHKPSAYENQHCPSRQHFDAFSNANPACQVDQYAVGCLCKGV